MAQPNRKPLTSYLRAARPTERVLRAILRNGADEADRLIQKMLEQDTTGSRIRAAQLLLVRRELRSQQSAMWGDIGKALREGISDVSQAAYTEAEDILLDYLRRNNQPTDTFLDSLRQQARRGLDHVLAKGANGISLSRQVYRTQALATGLVDRVVQTGLLLQHGAKEIARDASRLINPNVPGGVSYAAMRLARTELNNAFKTAQEQRYVDEPWTQGMRWNLSGSHPRPDECNVYADEDQHGLGAGVFPVGKRPLSHPNCLCFLTPVQADEDQFIEAFLAGQYDNYLEGLDMNEAEIADMKPKPRPPRVRR